MCHRIHSCNSQRGCSRRSTTPERGLSPCRHASSVVVDQLIDALLSLITCAAGRRRHRCDQCRSLQLVACSRTSSSNVVLLTTAATIYQQQRRLSPSPLTGCLPTLGYHVVLTSYLCDSSVSPASASRSMRSPAICLCSIFLFDSPALSLTFLYLPTNTSQQRADCVEVDVFNRSRRRCRRRMPMATRTKRSSIYLQLTVLLPLLTVSSRRRCDQRIARRSGCRFPRFRRLTRQASLACVDWRAGGHWAEWRRALIASLVCVCLRVTGDHCGRSVSQRVFENYYPLSVGACR